MEMKRKEGKNRKEIEMKKMNGRKESWIKEEKQSLGLHKDQSLENVLLTRRYTQVIGEG